MLRHAWRRCPLPFRNIPNRLTVLRTSKFQLFLPFIPMGWRGPISTVSIPDFAETRRRSVEIGSASIETTNERVNYRRVDGRKQAEGNSRRIPVGLPYPYSRPIVRRVINAARSGGRLIDGSQKPVAAWRGAAEKRSKRGMNTAE